MCFSAQASFAGAALLGITGLATFRYVKSKAQIPLALVPCFFAMQQLTEGLLWLTLGAERPNPDLQSFLVYSYLFFAIFFWPIWFPFSLYYLEDQPVRKKILFGIFSVGVVLGLFNLFYSMNQHIGVVAIEHSLHYTGKLPDIVTWLYVATVLTPCFLSSFKNIWQLGLLICATFSIAMYFYEATFVSVWCFFGAIVSVYMFKIFRDNASISDRYSSPS